jgi:hypothetical protein
MLLVVTEASEFPSAAFSLRKSDFSVGMFAVAGVTLNAYESEEMLWRECVLFSRCIQHHGS